MNADRAKLLRPVFMGSGLAAPRRPGMTAEMIARTLT
jgi:hypothetical protein